MMIDPAELPTITDIALASPRQQAEHTRAVVAGVNRDRVSVKIVEDVTHTDGFGGFVAGEVAGFPLAYAQSLVDNGFASFDLDAGPKPPARPQEMVLGTLTARAGGAVRMRMLRPYGNLFEGDVAGFNPALAHELHVRGIAAPAEPEAVKRVTLRSIREAIVRRFR